MKEWNGRDVYIPASIWQQGGLGQECVSSDAAGAGADEQGVAAWGHEAGQCWVSKADLGGVNSTKSLCPACCWLKRVAAALACLPQ